MKTSWILVAAALLACLVVIGSRRDEPVAASDSKTSRGPRFEVSVVMPRMALPLFGLLPDPLVAQLDGTPREVGFDHASRGARIGTVGHDRLELHADGWDLLIETDREGHIAPGSRLVFPLALGGRQVRLRCRPADRDGGYLRTATRAGADELGGRFLVRFAPCENADSGKAIEWPPAPLTVSGTFERLPHGGRSLTK